MELIKIAQICHEANKAYCETLGDFSQHPWADAPDWQKSSAVLGARLHSFDKGASPSASHNSWMAQKLNDGWKYGPVKDPMTKEHPCIVPFDELPKEQQIKEIYLLLCFHIGKGDDSIGMKERKKERKYLFV